jgi:uncharacterized protein YdcH (DUF465 family)
MGIKMEEKVTQRMDMETVNEIKSIKIQLLCVKDVIDAQHILVNEYRWKLLCMNLVKVSDMFQRLMDSMDEVITQISDIIEELKRLCEP